MAKEAEHIQYLRMRLKKYAVLVKKLKENEARLRAEVKKLQQEKKAMLKEKWDRIKEKDEEILKLKKRIAFLEKRLKEEGKKKPEVVVDKERERELESEISQTRRELLHCQDEVNRLKEENIGLQKMLREKRAESTIVVKGGELEIPDETHIEGSVESDKSIIIGKNVVINGDVISKKDVVVGSKGSINGVIQAEGDVKLSSGTEVAGDIISKGDVHLSAKCNVEEIVADGKVKVGRNSEVLGISAGGDVILEDGVTVEENVEYYGALTTGANVSINGSVIPKKNVKKTIIVEEKADEEEPYERKSYEEARKEQHENMNVNITVSSEVIAEPAGEEKEDGADKKEMDTAGDGTEKEVASEEESTEKDEAEDKKDLENEKEESDKKSKNKDDDVPEGKKRCPVCGALNDDDAEICIACGAEFEEL